MIVDLESAIRFCKRQLYYRYIIIAQILCMEKKLAQRRHNDTELSYRFGALITYVILLIEQLRKCHICKKYIKSRLLFLRHLRMHNDTQRTSGNSSKMVRRKLRGRPSTHKIASPRKRGRPRKF